MMTAVRCRTELFVILCAPLLLMPEHSWESATSQTAEMACRQRRMVVELPVIRGSKLHGDVSSRYVI